MNRWRIVWLFARTHRVPEASAIIVLLGVVIGASLSSDVGMLTADRVVVTPIVRLLPIAFGIAVVLPMGPVAADMEALDTGVLAKWRWALLGALLLVAIGSVVTAVMVTGAIQGSSTSVELAGTLTRGVLGWTGLALVAAAAIRPAYAWVLPSIGLVAVTLYGYDALGAPHWWNIAAQRMDAPPTWLVTILTAASGTAAWSITRWSRLAQLRRTITRPSQSRRKSQPPA